MLTSIDLTLPIPHDFPVVAFIEKNDGSSNHSRPRKTCFVRQVSMTEHLYI